MRRVVTEISIADRRASGSLLLAAQAPEGSHAHPVAEDSNSVWELTWLWRPMRQRYPVWRSLLPKSRAAQLMVAPRQGATSAGGFGAAGFEGGAAGGSDRRPRDGPAYCRRRSRHSPGSNRRYGRGLRRNRSRRHRLGFHWKRRQGVRARPARQPLRVTERQERELRQRAAGEEPPRPASCEPLWPRLLLPPYRKQLFLPLLFPRSRGRENACALFRPRRHRSSSSASFFP